jgi:hypothetical protein
LAVSGLVAAIDTVAADVADDAHHSSILLRY